MDRFSEHDPVETYFERQSERNAYEDDRWKERVEDEMVREQHDKDEERTKTKTETSTGSPDA